MIANPKRLLFEKTASMVSNMLNPRSAVYIRFEDQIFFVPEKK